eukprot:CAMPEP_0119411982 /NCGR_PEP_ID=MMETSP1335-20130426/4567_1 /TAXON_ID=259385 /ORGANISM="Chrysoculter rhomboideus, Strain RCC1486" /LENGTH=108 /DNA_ID=CAMNT_0007436685 /DNA_START=189 /DNA_END=515 /DNA_ORIENTATION=-
MTNNHDTLVGERFEPRFKRLDALADRLGIVPTSSTEYRAVPEHPIGALFHCRKVPFAKERVLRNGLVNTPSALRPTEPLFCCLRGLWRHQEAIGTRAKGNVRGLDCTS